MANTTPSSSTHQVSGNVPLNWSMHELLTSLIELIDQRHGQLGTVGEDGLVTATCSVCSGSGVILMVGEVDHDEPQSAGDPLVPAAVASASTPVAVVTSPAVVLATPVVQTPSVVQSAPVIQTASAVQAAPVVQATPAIPAMAPGPLVIPARTDPEPGNHSLVGIPPPLPMNAVYCGGNGDRFYCVTKGRRVGVFDSWAQASDYVSWVGSAVSKRFPTLEAAYRAYFNAYYSGRVTHF